MFMRRTLAGVLMLVACCLSGCDPLYGGVTNYYPEPVTMTLRSNSPHTPVHDVKLSSGQGFAYREPTKMLAISVTTPDGKTTTYNSDVIDKIVSDLREPNEQIMWAVTPEGLFADCIQHTVMRTCRKPGIPLSQWQESP